MPTGPTEITGRAGELWSALQGRIEDVRSVVTRTSDEDWSRRCEAEAWPVGLVAFHITLGLRRQAKWIERALAGRPPHAFDWERTHSLNVLVARRALRIRQADVLMALSDAADRWRRLLAVAGDAGLARAAFRHQERERAVEWVAETLTPRHIDEHLRSIRAALAADRA